MTTTTTAERYFVGGDLTQEAVRTGDPEAVRLAAKVYRDSLTYTQRANLDAEYARMGHNHGRPRQVRGAER
jgi:hypothetical protein